MPIKFEIFAIAIVIALAMGVAGGWTMNGWRLGARVEKQQGIIETQKQGLATFEGANKRCTAGVAEVKEAVSGFIAAGDKRAAAAAKAIADATLAAKVHLDAATEALNRPPVERGKECEGVAAEASKYAQKRKAAP